jgi:hypothetical protein
MAKDPILLIGGSGMVGRWAARFLQEAHPKLPLLIGGRDLDRAREIAATVENAEGVALDLSRADIGLGDRPVGAVGVLFMDTRVAGLRFAQSRRVPYVNIVPMPHEIGPEIAAYMSAPEAAPVVLGTEWLVGATTMPVLTLARDFKRLETIVIGALLDDEDTGGPAQTDDLERITKAAPAALTLRGGKYVWRAGEEADAIITAIDGTRMEASGLSPHDVLALANLTGAQDIEFNLATGTSSSRRRGGTMSTEIIIELAGTGHDGRPLKTRHAVTHPKGQFPLTGLGVALLLDRLTGADGKDAPGPGLYFPSQLLDPDRYMKRFAAAGGELVALDAETDAQTRAG